MQVDGLLTSLVMFEGRFEMLKCILNEFHTCPEFFKVLITSMNFVANLNQMLIYRHIGLGEPYEMICSWGHLRSTSSVSQPVAPTAFLPPGRVAAARVRKASAAGDALLFSICLSGFLLRSSPICEFASVSAK